VLVSNLGGSTGALLSLDKGKLAGKLHLDVLYPVNGFKRCLDGQNGFGENYPPPVPAGDGGWVGCLSPQSPLSLNHSILPH